MTRLAAIALAIIAIAAGVAGALLGSPWESEPAATTAIGDLGNTNTKADQQSIDDATRSIVATAVGSSVDVYTAPEADQPQSALTNPIQSGAPLTFLMRERQGDWLRVLLPLRPNGATGWIKANQVRLTSHHYKIQVFLSAHRLLVTEKGAAILDTPAGIGRSETPTPGGLYFTKELLQPPNPDGAYGHFAYGLSGYSNVLTSFNGGDGVIGIHGTNDPSGLGKDVSHGCIRVSNEAIGLLAGRLPLGVPVEISA